MKPIRRNIGCMGGTNKGLNCIRKNQPTIKQISKKKNNTNSQIHITPLHNTFTIHIHNYCSNVHLSIGRSQLQHYFYTCLLNLLTLQRREKKKLLKNRFFFHRMNE